MPDKKTKSRKLTANSSIPFYFKWRFISGFTFIELLVVITLMAIVGATVSAAYLGFENRQRVKEAALIVGSGIRAFQNNASSGRDINCTGGTLVGWFFGISVSSNQLFYGVYCNPFSFASFSASSKTLNLPQGVKLVDVQYGPVGAGVSISAGSNYIFYRTLNSGYSFHTGLPFFNASTGDLTYLVGTLPQSPLTIILSGFGVTYDVVVMPSGEVYETQM